MSCSELLKLAFFNSVELHPKHQATTTPPPDKTRKLRKRLKKCLATPKEKKVRVRKVVYEGDDSEPAPEPEPRPESEPEPEPEHAEPEPSYESGAAEGAGEPGRDALLDSIR